MVQTAAGVTVQVLARLLSNGASFTATERSPAQRQLVGPGQLFVTPDVASVFLDAKPGPTDESHSEAPERQDRSDGVDTHTVLNRLNIQCRFFCGLPKILRLRQVRSVT
jgi:hypothetical protein